MSLLVTPPAGEQGSLPMHVGQEPGIRVYMPGLRAQTMNICLKWLHFTTRWDTSDGSYERKVEVQSLSK